MESNKEEAQKCIQIAKKALLENKTEKAFKFLQKSIKLYPTETAKELLKTVENTSNERSDASEGNKKNLSGSQSDFSELHGSAQPEIHSYTQAQKDLAQRINRCKDYYEILGVNKNGTDAEIKKAYRKMALQLHPDKNLAPGSTEAFKAVGKAFSILSDKEKRDRYDLYGPEGVETSTRRRRRNSSNEYEDEAFDPQELFNMFFGGGFPTENVRVFRTGNGYYYNRQRANVQRQDDNGFGNFLRSLPIIIFILSTIVSNYYVPQPAYSLFKTREFHNPKVTSSLKITYYVKNDFNEKYPRGRSRNEVENNVETEYLSSLRNSCHQEQLNKEHLRRKGIYFGDSKLVEKSNKMSMPSCDELEKFKMRGL